MPPTCCTMPFISINVSVLLTNAVGKPDCRLNSSTCVGSSIKMTQQQRFFGRFRHKQLHSLLLCRLRQIQFFQHILDRRNQLRTFLNQPVGTFAGLARHRTGHSKTSRFCSSANEAVIKAPLRSPASTTIVPSDNPLIMRLRGGKFLASGGVSRAYSEIKAPCPATICSAKRRFSGG